MSSLIDRIRSADDFCALEPADNLVIAEAQTKLGLRFAEDYIEYLSAFGVATFDNRELTGICTSERLNVVSVTEHARSYFNSFPSDYYVIEELLIDHAIVVQDRSGSVYSYGLDESAKVISHTLYEYLFEDDISQGNMM